MKVICKFSGEVLECICVCECVLAIHYVLLKKKIKFTYKIVHFLHLSIIFYFLELSSHFGSADFCLAPSLYEMRTVKWSIIPY